VQFFRLHPLCFAEYLQATGNNEAANIVLGSPQTVSQTIHEFLCEELRRYFFIGGMPESVVAYLETGSMRESFEVQAEICDTYRLDFSKYSPHADKYCLNFVLTTVAQSVGQQIKYSRLADGYSNPTLKKAFNLLCLANIIRKVPSVDPSGLPLGATAAANIFKALMVDIGLMRHLTGMPVDVEYRKADLLNIYRGAMAEQFVGQEMAFSQKEDLYYWSRRAKSSSAEVDYKASCFQYALMLNRQKRISCLCRCILPFRLHGKVAAGRLHRLHDMKTEVIIYDYADLNVQITKS
jgi:hypothetical protein